ncbi:MAG: hypothetical protein WAK04_08390 [Xanthobacteraceae bacterium]
MWTRIPEGDYSPDDLARMLLRASSGSYREAKKALTRASNDRHAASPPFASGVATSDEGAHLMTYPPIVSGMAFTSDEGVYLMAYAIQRAAIEKKKPCRDSTALKKLLGPGKYRVFWDRLRKRDQKHGQTLQQIAQLIGAEAAP